MHGAGQGTLHITFDGNPLQPPGTAYTVQRYEESGKGDVSVLFTPLSSSFGFTRVGSSPLSFRPDDGSAYLAAAFTQSLMFRLSNGSLFDLVSVDLAEYSTVVPNAVSVHFIGYRFDGSIVTTDLITDGIIDGTGPLVDFQTFQFDDRFTGLTRVEIPTSGWSLDNLVVSVPEPSTWGLLLAGGVCLGVLKFRKRATTERHQCSCGVRPSSAAARWKG